MLVFNGYSISDLSLSGLSSELLDLLLLGIVVDLLIMCNQLLNSPRSLSSGNVIWRTGIENPGFSLICFFLCCLLSLGWPFWMDPWVHELWEAHWDVLSFLVGLEQVAVESGLLNHGRVDLVASSELLLEVRVAVDHTSECWLLSVGGWLGPLVEEPHGWKGGESDPNLWLRILSVSIFLRIQQGTTYTQALFGPWSGMAVISSTASRGGELRRAHSADSTSGRGRLASEGDHCVVVELSFES